MCNKKETAVYYLSNFVNKDVKRQEENEWILTVLFNININIKKLNMYKLWEWLIKIWTWKAKSHIFNTDFRVFDANSYIVLRPFK